MRHIPPRINVPVDTDLVRLESVDPDLKGYSTAVLPIGHSTNGMNLKGNLYVQKGGRELSISQGTQSQLNALTEWCGFRCTPDNLYTKWLRRWYTVTGVTKNCFFKNCPVEHADYFAPGPGDLTWDECLYFNIAANAIQLRLSTIDNTNLQPEASPYWDTKRTITLNKVLMLECGQKRGGGRAAFAFSPKSPGPNTTLVLNNCFIQNIHQVNVDGKGHNSFGGMCFETCKTVEIHGGVVELNNPANGAIQFYEYDSKPSTSLHRAPKNIVVDTDFACENNMDIRIDDSPYVRISPCLGNGNIRLFKASAGDRWTVVDTIPVSHGYNQG